MPYQEIACSSCGNGKWSVILWGQFVWRDNEQREFFIDRELGFCRDCEQIVAKEKLPSRDDYNEAKDAFHAGFLRRLFITSRLDRNPFQRSLVAEALDRRSGFEVLEAVMALGREPVCLQCGSDRVFAIPIPETDGRWDCSWIPTGVKHPDCGGEFLVRGSGGNRVAVRLYKRSYDTRGRFLEATRIRR